VRKRETKFFQLENFNLITFQEIISLYCHFILLVFNNKYETGGMSFPGENMGLIDLLNCSGFIEIDSTKYLILRKGENQYT
jgi:hypothetical protein